MELMDGNYTLVTEFVLLGFPTHPELQIVLFLMFLTLYGMILTGNIGLMMLIRIDPHLQTPMYFFLSNLSFADLCYSSVIVPKMLFNFLSENKGISYYGCALQFYFFCTSADTASFILAAMAYDRHVTICNPLPYIPYITPYRVVMSQSICTWLIVLSCIGGNMRSLVHTSFAFILKYCDKNVINHFSVTTLPCLSHPAQTHQLMSGFSPLTAAQWKLSVSLSSSPTSSSFVQSWRSALPVGRRKPSPHVPLTWLLWPSIWGPFSSFTHGPATCILPTLIKLSPCSTPLSSQCWILWFIVWEIKMYRMLLRELQG